MKNFVMLAMLTTGLMFSSCEKENKVAEEIQPINSFEEFQAWAGDRLVFSEERSDDEFDCYLYYLEDRSIEPSVIAQAKQSADKGPMPQLECDMWLEVLNNIILCYGPGNDCARGGNGAIMICNWSKLKAPNQW